MYKKTAFIFFFLLTILSSAQNKQLLDSLKQHDNLSEFIYVHLDAFIENKSIENLVVFEKLEANLWRNPTNESEQISQLYFYINYAYQLKEFGLINQSVFYYEKGYDFFESSTIKNYDIIEYCLKPLANNYTRLGDADRAEDILKITIEKAQSENNTNQIIAGYSNLAVVLRTKGKIGVAINYLKLGLNLSNSNNIKSRLYSDLAMNYLLQNDLKSAIKNVEISNSLNTNQLSISINNYKTLGSVFLQQKDVDKSISAYQKALNLAQKEYGKNNRQVAKIQNQIGEAYATSMEYTLALEYFQKALLTLLPKYAPKTVEENPTSLYFYAENTLKESFDGRANVFSKMNEYEEALKNYRLSFIVEDELRSTYLTQNAKLLQQQGNRNRAEKSIDLCYELYSEEADAKWVERAFLIAEKTKSLVLFNAKESSLNKSKIKNDSLFEIEKELNFKKTQLNKKIALEQLKNTRVNINLLAKLTEDRNSVFTQLKIINQEIDLKFPNLKTNIDSVISIQKVKEKLLNESTSLIEVFEGKDHVYIFNISKSELISVFRIDNNTDFKNDILGFLGLFSSHRGVEIQNNVKKYTELGSKIFKKLFKVELTENIIIIPDGIFSFLPFDALLTEETGSRNFEKLPYLINKASVSYGYSASILLQDEKKISSKEKNVLGFFPIFKNNHRNLAELNYTQQESENIKNVAGGNYLIGEKALKNEFNKLSQQFPIIHLSTHASAGDYYTPAAIEFYDETLYLQEIYGYNLNTDLLVLSACETGIGTLRRGEGVLSLARGFSYAGVKNLIVSLWKVNDKATELLMTGFYKNYEQNNSKSEALHQSKLEYLSNTAISVNKKSPYYWASFIYLGETNIAEKSNFSFYWFLIIAFAAMLSIFLYKKQ